MRSSMSGISAITASINAAQEAEARLTVSLRHGDAIGALPPNLMSARRKLCEARRRLSYAISNLKEHSA